jgi:hypothetical protein
MVGRKICGGNQTMQARMEQQVLTPTVQHGKETDLCAEMLGVGRDLEQGSRRRGTTGVFLDWTTELSQLFAIHRFELGALCRKAGLQPLCCGNTNN